MESNILPLDDEIESYWNRRADSYSGEVRYELEHDNKEKWFSVIEENLSEQKKLKVLDIGTGPGFFAIGMAERGHVITAIDCTEGMLLQAKENAGKYADEITFLKMDAQKPEFEENSFDVIMTRNVTWNLQDPQTAYREWYRILKKDGILLNFDAAWYSYLYDDEKRKNYQKDRIRIKESKVKDFGAYAESSKMEEIACKLPFSHCERPKEDIRMLKEAGFASVTADTAIGERVWSETEKINYVSRPMFLLRAIK